jgi:hypothetical protein
MKTMRVLMLICVLFTCFACMAASAATVNSPAGDRSAALPSLVIPMPEPSGALLLAIDLGSVVAIGWIVRRRLGAR